MDTYLRGAPLTLAKGHSHMERSCSHVVNGYGGQQGFQLCVCGGGGGGGENAIHIGSLYRQ